MGAQAPRARRSRPRPTRERHRRILVVCGGKVTEPTYLGHLNVQLRTSGVRVEVARSGKDPETLVREAIEHRAREVREARAADDPGNVYDEVWVMFDVDDFAEGVPRALEAAQRNHIRCAVSNPCFEIWLVWHIADANAYATTRHAQQQARDCGATQSGKAKSIDLSSISGRFADARTRAVRAEKNHGELGRVFPHDNPRSDVYKLVDSILDGVARARPGAQPLL
ncbi:RloB family protein [Planococcus sp. APC 4015]|nr:RloB family protein [Planococcus sp. APC 4015]